MLSKHETAHASLVAVPDPSQFVSQHDLHENQSMRGHQNVYRMTSLHNPGQ